MNYSNNQSIEYISGYSLRFRFISVLQEILQQEILQVILL